MLATIETINQSTKHTFSKSENNCNRMQLMNLLHSQQPAAVRALLTLM
jgi:hypothetical protein